MADHNDPNAVNSIFSDIDVSAADLYDIFGFPGDDRTGKDGRPRLRFYDNLDGRTLELALASLDIKTTRFVVISKSGNTPETLVQIIAAIEAVRKEGLADRVPELFLALTEPKAPGVSNGLRSLCQAFSIPMLDHDPGIGGRFSGLTNVGLLPALARGLDVEALREGAQGVVEAMLKLGLSKPWPEALAAFTGERDLDAGAIIDYFAPLDRWLTEQNKGERCGW